MPLWLSSFSEEKAPTSKDVHCMLNRQVLTTKTLPDTLQKILDEMIQIVNSIKAGALNFRLFKKCMDLDSKHLILLYHTQTQWLSKENVTQRFFKLKEFSQLKNKIMYSWLEDEEWLLSLAYLRVNEIFEQLNRLNLRMQGKDTNIIMFVDALKAFKSKLADWKRKVKMHNYTMLEKLDILLDERLDGMPNHIKNGILEHLSALKSEFERYFSETTDEDLDFVKNPFKYPVEKLADECQDKFLELINDSTARQEYEEKLLSQFWVAIKDSYPKTTEKALCILIPFVSTYLCESGFSSLLQIKSKQMIYRHKMIYIHNRLDVENDLRCALSQTDPRIRMLSDSSNKKVNYRINSIVQINASLNLCVSLFRPVVTRIVCTLFE